MLKSDLCFTFASMIELARHIEALLLENDCVIIPGIGGFVTHYTASTHIEEENLFIPPSRSIGFNPLLKMNDGLLTQSYMSVYGTNFSDATKMVEKKAEEFIALLHEEGKAELPNIGEVRCSISGDYSFVPYDNKLISPQLYGLDTFEMQALSALSTEHIEKKLSPIVTETVQPELIPQKPKRAYLMNAVAATAAVILFFAFSTPIRNTEVIGGANAKLSPAVFFEQVKAYSMLTSPVVMPKQPATNKPAEQAMKPAEEEKIVSSSVHVGTTKAKKPQTDSPVASGSSHSTAQATKNAENSSNSIAAQGTISSEKTSSSATTSQPEKNRVAPSAPIRSYHIIVASVGTEQDAEQMAAELANKGYAGAKAIIGDGKMRVCIQSCGTETEAYQALIRIRENTAYQTAWILKK